MSEDFDETHPDFAAAKLLAEKLDAVVMEAVDQGLSHERIQWVFEGMVAQIKAEADVIGMGWKLS